ncbi:uncharacterized protein [Montipora foliosa]|uniref:uncharacterized protein isoform X3 n=1 Tax=Montipora foliosa TaxID=591990 RepID=UPI0035F11910
MLQGLARYLVIVVFIISASQVIGHDSERKNGGGRNYTKISNTVKINKTTKFNKKFHKNARVFSWKRPRPDKTRKYRDLSLAALEGLDRPALGLTPLTMPYATRLAALSYPQTPALQQLPQYRGLIPTTNGMLQNAAALRLPYRLQLARLLPGLALYRNQLQLPRSEAGNLATDVHVFKTPDRLKYNSIPLKPGIQQQELLGNGFSLPTWLQLNSAEDGSISDLADDDLDELGGVCLPNPCHNGGSCVNLGGTYECACKKGYKGRTCKERNPCLPNPCNNEGQCTVGGKGFECSCSSGWKGERCEEPDKCRPNPCHNGGSCTELLFDYECTCPHGYHGKHCEDKKASCAHSPCLNDGRCVETAPGSYECICKPSFSGPTCAGTRDKCLQNPCQNAGTCIESLGGEGYTCRCPTGFKGINCEERSPCQPDTCQNGASCFETESGFKCLCQLGYTGKTCSVRHSCQPDLCKNGAKCIEHDSGFKCICSPGFKGSFCDEVDHCRPNPCQHRGDCIETPNGFKCNCRAQYQGSRCEDLNMCVPNPCKNGGQCLGFEGGFKCLCSPGFTGPNCDDKNPCDPNPCHNGAACRKEGDHFTCSCRRGYTGEQCQMVDSCLSNPCQHGGTCMAQDGGFVCTCPANYRGTICNEREPCHPNPCRNAGKCLSTSEGFVCRCATGYRGETCSEEDECEPNPCQNGGRCVGHYFGGGFDCECPLGFRGTTCQDKDPCRPNPCSNQGICSEIGGGFVCNCSLGFKGPTCQEIDQCRPNPCLHGGYCREVVGGTGFACRCITGYKGARCDARDRCHPNPCLHDGMCMEVNDDLGYLCNCTVGYRGSHCENIDPCRPNPCLNSGACLHNDDGFVCNCSVGFKGKNCQERDLCKPNPCQFGNKCHQTGMESYQCVKNLCNPSPCMHNGRCIEINDEDYTCACTPGYFGKTCDEMDLCHPNPCMNSGNCSRTKFGGYKCSCIPGYHGTNCLEFQDSADADSRHKVPLFHSRTFSNNLKAARPLSSIEVHDKLHRVDYCSPNPCKNKGVCVVEEGKGYSCSCNPGFTGFHCQDDHCTPNPCLHQGLCVRDKTRRFKCKCNNGFLGKNCQINSCQPNPCKNGGLCVTVSGKGYQCKCREGFNGPHCENNPCSPNPCHNGGTCIVFYTVYLCKCPRAYRGTRCNVLIPEKALAPAPPPVTSAKFIYEDQAIRKTTANQKTNPCSSNPCLNSAVCLETIDDNFECFCRGDFSGPRCEDVGAYTYSSAPKFFPGKGEECQHCHRNAHCVGGHCICKHGFVGDGLDCWVETQRDKDWDCQPSPCQNGGTCKPGSSKCVCRLGYVGQFCESLCPPSVHLSFDKFTQGTLQDDSGSENNAIIVNGAQIAPHAGKCGNAVNLLGGDVLLDGAHFYKIPREGITISTWIKLDTNKGIQSIFDTVGSHSRHRDGQYHFEIDNGKVRWFHRNENHDTIFSLLTRPVVKEAIWIQLTATYSAKMQRARVFVNGDLNQETSGRGLLSLDWGGKAGIGRHAHPFGSRLLRGMIDEFYIFPCELPRLEVLVLMRHCRVYFKNTKKVTDESSETRGSAPFMTRPIIGQRNNQVNSILAPRPAISQVIHTAAPANQRPMKPPPSEDFIANNLQQILASLTSDDHTSSHPSVVHQSVSAVHQPTQMYGLPSQQSKSPLPNRPAPYPSTKLPTVISNRVPQASPFNWWTNHQPKAATAVPAQALLRPGSPSDRQSFQPIRRPGIVQPALEQASLVRPFSQNRQFGLFAPSPLQASLRHDTPAGRQQGNTIGVQRIPLGQNVIGQYQQFHTSAAPGELLTQTQNEVPELVQPNLFSNKVRGYGQIQSPIVWHIPSRNVDKVLQEVSVKPFFSAAPLRISPLAVLRQNNPLRVQNRTVSFVQGPSYLKQKPLVQAQQVSSVQPFQLPNSKSSNQQQESQQKSLEYKMAMLEETSQKPQVNVLRPQVKEQASYQTSATIRHDTSPVRPFGGNYIPRPFSHQNAQQRVQTPSALGNPKAALPFHVQNLPYGIPPKKVSPFSPHFIYGQKSWPWSVWKNQVSPISLPPSQSSSPLRLQANGANLLQYQPTSGFAAKLPLAPRKPTPKVLMYYYYYPRTITKPLVKVANVGDTKQTGNFWGKLRQQISTLGLNGNQGLTTITGNPTAKGQTNGKVILTQAGQFQPKIVPDATSKQLYQTSQDRPTYRLIVGSSKVPLAPGIVTETLANQLSGQQQAQTPLWGNHLWAGMQQMTYSPLLTPQLISPNIAQKVNTETQANKQISVGDRRSQLTKGLFNRPIYIQTVPYQLYNLLQQLPSLNTQSGTQRYLSRVLSDIVSSRYGKRKKKKKREGERM